MTGNLQEVIVGVAMFTTVVLALVVLILIAKSFLVATGDGQNHDQ